MGNTDLRAACRPRSSRRAGSLPACRNSRYESTWMASRNGTSRIERRLPKSLRMRFFSVNDYAVVMGSYRLGHLRAAHRATRGNNEPPVGSCWYCRHQHAFSRYSQLPTRCRFSIRPLQRPKAGGLRPQPRGRLETQATRQRLLDFDRGAGRFQVLLDLLGFFLRSAFLDHATGFGQVLGFLQAQAGDRADHLDDLDLLVAGRLQGDVELGLLFGGGGGGGRTG